MAWLSTFLELERDDLDYANQRAPFIQDQAGVQQLKLVRPRIYLMGNDTEILN